MFDRRCCGSARYPSETMKMLRPSFFFLFVSTAVTIVHGFVPRSMAITRRPLFVTTESDFTSAMPETKSVEMTREEAYAALELGNAELAYGLKAEEVLKYIGTREDLITKTLKDIPSFDRAKAEAEVDKFLLDKECVEIMIEFAKRREADPDFVVPSAEDDEGLFSLRNVLGVYAVYIGVTSGPNAFRKYVAEQEAAGNWDGSGIPFVDNWLEESKLKAIEKATAAAQEAAQAAADSATDSLDSVAAVAADSLDSVSAAADALMQTQ